MSEELQEREVSGDLTADDNLGEVKESYGIYNYLKEHTAFAVTCVSAIIAIISFIFNYAISMYISSYLQYWHVDTMYGIQNAKNLFFSVFSAFLYIVVMLLIQSLVSRTAIVYRRHYELLYRHKKSFRILKKQQRKQKQKFKAARRRFKKFKENPEVVSLCAELDGMEKEWLEVCAGLLDIKDGFRRLRKHLFWNVFGSVIFAVIVGSAAFFLLLTPRNADIRWVEKIIAAILIIVPLVLFTLLLYWIPSFFEVRRKGKDAGDEVKQQEISNSREELVFPFEK